MPGEVGAVTSLEGKVCLITGATAGIGRATAESCAALNATVVLGARDRARGAATVDAIRARVPGARLEVLALDLASLASVSEAANDLKHRFSRLDVLINNAGISSPRYAETIDGLETTFAVNHLGHFRLTLELLDLLRANARARIINVSSSGHAATLDLEGLQTSRGFDNITAYRQTKLCNILFTRELARRLAGTGVTANAFDPGAVRTDIGRDLPPFLRMIRGALRPFLLRPEQSAAWIVRLASAPELAQVSGAYFVKDRQAQPKAGALDDSAAAALWDASERLTVLRTRNAHDATARARHSSPFA